MKNKYQSFDFPTGKVVGIVACFLLAILDMMFLYKALQGVTAGIIGTSNNAGPFMIVALIMATAANVTALVWGIKNGESMASKAVNKYTLGYFLGWGAIGIAYFIIRILDLRNSISISGDLVNVPGHLVSMGILAVSYVGTGTMIQSFAREIFDAQLRALRKAKKKFDRANEDLADSYADIKESIGILKNYDINYRTLNVQYEKCLTSMIRTENATMSVIVGKVLSRHNEVNPKLANDILKEVINERDNKWIHEVKK